jgi:hypothetical protein
MGTPADELLASLSAGGIAVVRARERLGYYVSAAFYAMGSVGRMGSALVPLRGTYDGSLDAVLSRVCAELGEPLRERFRHDWVSDLTCGRRARLVASGLPPVTLLSVRDTGGGLVLESLYGGATSSLYALSGAPSRAIAVVTEGLPGGSARVTVLDHQMARVLEVEISPEVDSERAPDAVRFYDRVLESGEGPSHAHVCYDALLDGQRCDGYVVVRGADALRRALEIARGAVRGKESALVEALEDLAPGGPLYYVRVDYVSREALAALLEAAGALPGQR